MYGFELIREAYLKEISSRVRYFKHTHTGAELVSVENDDDNKSFGVGLLTPPIDSTGLPHILEHSVLAGSRKYRVKEPFVELLKTSLASFINAMTFPDMTIYPVASTNLKDFYNLVDVYLDAVFFPLITENTFKQEGWHYEVTNPDEALSYKGVVYNEMKGYFSTPEFILADEVKRFLMPDTPYANNSGGNPAVMPDLTYQAFKQFHATYYHPSNARFFFYGDDNPEERLRLVNDYIKDFTPASTRHVMPLQPRWNAPRQATVKVDAGESDEDDNKGLMTVNWLFEEIPNNLEVTMGLQLLSHVLLSTSASPLRKALIDSGLGEDVTGGGIDTYAREASFSIGLKGILPEDSPKIEAFILETLANLAEEGIDPATIEATMNTVEFAMRERNTGRYPRGLAVMVDVMSTWLHGADPIELMSFEDYFQAIKDALANDPRYFEQLIGKYLLQNTHRLTLTMEPDPAVKTEREDAEKSRLEAEKAHFSPEQIQELITQTQELKALQEAPDDPEELAKLPTLLLGDLDREIKVTHTEELLLEGVTTYYHDLATNGIVYVDMGFNLKTLPAHYVPYMALFSKALTEMGTKTEDFVRLTQRIGAKTGGVGASDFISVRKDRDGSVAYLFLSGKAIASQTQDLLDIFKDILLSIQFDNKERFKQLVLRDKVTYESWLGMMGHGLASSRLRAQFDEVGWFGEQTGGVSQLLFLRQLAEKVETDWESVLAVLEDMRRLLFTRHGAILNVTAENALWTQFKPQLEAFLNTLPDESFSHQLWEVTRTPPYEAFAVTTQVNFVGKGANLYDLGYVLSGSHRVVLRHLNLTHLWTKVRVQGGAYGGRLSFDPNSGVAVAVSWQDPNITETLNAYDTMADFLSNVNLSQEELEKAIIGTVGSADTPMFPDMRGFTATIQRLLGVTKEDRQRNRDEMFATTLQDFHSFGEVLHKFSEHGFVVVTGSPDALTKANDSLARKLEILPLQ